MKKLPTIFLIFFVVFNLYSSTIVLSDDFIEDAPIMEVFSNTSNEKEIKVPKINAQAAIVIDAQSGRILFEKDAYKKRPMASTTKIMTGILAIENGNLNDTVTVSKRAASVWGSTIKLKEEEKLKLGDLLYGLMLRSGNDAAIAVAEHIGGSVENFLDMMNKKAIEIGAYSTSFKSPHGLDKDGHYTTPYDLALITRYALENKTFSDIVGTKSIYAADRDMRNTNEMLSMYSGADGVKTGYTGQAGRCLVTSATRDNFRIISVVLNAASRMKRAESSRSILDYSFKKFKPEKLISKEKSVRSVFVNKGIKNEVWLYPLEDITYPISEEEKNGLEKKIICNSIFNAPIDSNVELGRIEIVVNNKVLASTPLITMESIRRKTIVDYLEDVLINWCRLMH